MDIHHINILLHVITGTSALVLGIIALLSRKGKSLHVTAGRWFLGFMSVVILTGLIGVFVFKVNTFLLVITLSSGYQGFAGYRVLQTKSNKPYILDISAIVLTLSACVYFLYYFNEIGMFWDPVIIYSTVGYLLALISYDLLKYLIPSERYGTIWLKEHVFKMIGAFSALLSAFSGTVLDMYQPYSQFMPSVFCLWLMVFFMWRINQKSKVKGDSFIPSSP